MKYVKMISLAAVAALTLTGLVAGSSSATMLEVGGVGKNEAVTYTETIKAGTSTIVRDTFGFSSNTCTGSDVHWDSISPWVTAKIGLVRTVTTLTNCTNSITVHKSGSGSITHIAGTTNGTVTSTGAEVTVFSALHNTYINCKTTGQTIGTLTGVKHGQATMDINATLNCEPHLSSAKWTGTYTVTTEGIGVSA